MDQWGARYADRDMAGLLDEDRPGRPSSVDQSKIITATTLGMVRPSAVLLGLIHG